MTDTTTVPDHFLHPAPCLLSLRGNWVAPDDTFSYWRAIDAAQCTCPADGVETAREEARRKLAENLDVPLQVIADGGWRAPAAVAYPLFGEITTRRGGIQFTAPAKQLEELDPEELLVRAKWLDKRNDELTRALNVERRRTRKLRRKMKRLLRLVEKLA